MEANYSEKKDGGCGGENKGEESALDGQTQVGNWNAPLLLAGDGDAAFEPTNAAAAVVYEKALVGNPDERALRWAERWSEGVAEQAACRRWKREVWREH